MTKPTLLFLSFNNSCTGQMAEGWAEHLLSNRFVCFSAGLRPMGLDLFAARVMKEAGVDISQHQSKRITDIAEPHFDLVVILSDRVPDDFIGHRGGTVLRWHLKDGSDVHDEDSALELYRDLRDEIRALVVRWTPLSRPKKCFP